MVNFINKEHECFPTHYILNRAYPYFHKEGSMRGIFLLHEDIELSIYGYHNLVVLAHSWPLLAHPHHLSLG